MMKFPTLMYHDIIVSESQAHKVDLIYSIEEHTFIEQLEYLRNSGHHSISLDEYVKLHSHSPNLKSKNYPIEKPIIITFDDGHISNYTQAFPLLQKYGFAATFFITLKSVNSQNGMTWEQLREMADSGMSIQSHTMTHPFLSDLDAKQIRWELEGSKSILEDKLGKPVDFLALPGGRYSSTARKIAEEVGYKAVCTSKIGYNTLRTNLHSLRRWTIKRNMSIATFRSIIQMNPLTTFRYKTVYFILNGLKKALGNKNYVAVREKLLR